MVNLKIQECEGSIVFSAKVVPASSKTALCGLLNGMLKIKVAAPAEKGKANQCLIKFLAGQLDLKKGCIAIKSGETNPVKTIQVSGISTELLLRKLDLPQ